MQQIIDFLMSILNKISKSQKTTINNTDTQPDASSNQHTISGMCKVVTIVEDKVVKPIKVIDTTNKKEIKAMYKFGARSRERLDSCHQDIISVLEETIKIYDFSVLEGLRTSEKQLEYFETGRSKLDGVNKKSKHQDDGSGKSSAIDIMPYAKGSNAFSGKQKDLRRFYFLMGIVRAISERLLAEGKISHSVRFGLDWNSNDLYDDQSFDDLPHLELIAPRNK